MDVNFARFDLVSIRLAVLCAELGSLSAASKRVHCSLSTGSYRLSALEDTFGKRLFTRDHRGLHATEAGELFVRHGRTILEHVELMNRQVTLADAGVGV
ncbi:MAG: LysR family transcriptional regulator [Pseudomonadota bacterium]